MTRSLLTPQPNGAVRLNCLWFRHKTMIREIISQRVAKVLCSRAVAPSRSKLPRASLRPILPYPSCIIIVCNRIVSISIFLIRFRNFFQHFSPSISLQRRLLNDNRA